MPPRVRLPRLTLFSGPQCSLCDVDILLLFATRCGAKKIVHARSHARAAPVHARDNQHPGSRPDQVEAEIRVRYPSAPSGGQARSQGTMGARGSDDGSEDMELDSGSEGGGFQEELDHPLLDDTYVKHVTYHSYGNVRILGLDSEPELSDEDPQGSNRHCWNCDSPSHTLTECPLPRDAERIQLARSAFLADSLGGGRFYEAAEWRKQRLAWADAFEPGRIRGAELRDALGLAEQERPGELENMYWFNGGTGNEGGMLMWGYPPGWLETRDPRLLMKERILAEDELGETTWTSTLAMRDLSSPDEYEYDSDSDSELDEAEVELDRSLVVDHNPSPPPSPPPAPPDDEPEPELRRWATYPTTLFSSALLPISQIHFPLPPLTSSSNSPSGPSLTFNQDRRALWESIVSGRRPRAQHALLPPWRREGAFDFTPSRSRPIA
ncbi:hypothetical protein BOTBODRAFT_489171 [Botryobasidium botryosum FD-172 SS1]|uniref:CCHC-type domain-containing protein n=1 Tax=Botryobasidium botryosum (strain FD-172 SS1) TaxID=930990 RepID=A0A067MG33_BOTB1|nr:hypothetical protein BOTBODRAFT_489171 [Botryobasidium botryosum FD-172 SS1]